MLKCQRHNDMSEVDEAESSAIVVVSRLNMSIVSVAKICIGPTVKQDYKMKIII